MSPYLLDGLRVVELTTGIAGAYATKLLADAGADVVKVEPPGGDPLRRWSASRQELRERDGALFQYLAGSKRIVRHEPGVVGELLAGADVVVDGGSLADDDLARACRARTAVVTISPFGRDHELADLPATEFTLQAWCGSIAGRGPVDRPPLYAAGQLGEWLSGAYAAAAALALVHGRAGGHADLSMLECMTPPLGGLGALMARFLGVDEDATRGRPVRSLETPSIARTSDGLVGFCTVTGQQFQDFLTLIERPDLIGDERYASFPARMARQAEFESIVSAWTTVRTTAEVVDLAVAFRIPVAPVATPDSITAVDHFVERGVYAPNPGAGFLQPQAPYRVHGVPMRVVEPVLDGGEPSWSSARSAPSPNAPPDAPLDGLRVVDLTAFWAGPAATQLLASLGADVVKVEGPKRPDGMRFTSARPPTDPQWLEWSAIFHAVNTNKRAVTLDLGNEAERRRLLDLVVDADVVIENFSPRVLDSFGITFDVIHEVNPRAVMVRMPGFGLDGPWRDRAGFAQTMEQASGLAWITGHRDGLPVIPRGLCDPLAGIHAAFATLAALEERRRSGVGRLVEVSMIDAALACAAEVVIEWSAYGCALERDGNRGPVAAPQGVYACAGSEEWLALAVRDDDDWTKLMGALGRPRWALAARYADDPGRRAHHDELDQHLAETLSTQSLADVVDRLLRAGVPAAPVVPAARALHHPAIRARGFAERVEHPVVGSYDVMGLPFRLRGREGGWVRRPAPTLGQDNAEVLGTLRR